MPLRRGLAVVSGLAGVDPKAQIQAAAHAPYPFAQDLRIGRVWLSDAQPQVGGLEQNYDFSCGELLSRFQVSVDGVRVDVETITFCSRTQPTLALQESHIRVDRPCHLMLRAGVDPGDIQGRWLRRHTDTPGEPAPVVDGSLCWETLGGISTCGVAYTTEFLGEEDVRQARWEREEQTPLVTAYAFDAAPDRTYRLRQITSLVPSQLHEMPDREATRLAALGTRLGFDALREENRQAWRELWRGRICLDGAEAHWQALADAAFFYLNSSVHPSSPSSTSIFGLAEWYNYHYYYGHIMWDLDQFALPVLTLLQPPAAHALLDYRWRSLPAARANAQLNGRAGAQFPWESSMSRGQEAAPGAATGAWFEDYVSLVVARAFAQYEYVTGDQHFQRSRCWPVLHDVAEWLESRVQRTERGYEYRRTMGIAEREQPADNVAFTNMAAKLVLGDARSCAQRLGYASSPAWAEIERGLVLPLDGASGVMQSYDGFRPSNEKGATPSPAAALFPLGYDLDPALERATLTYFLQRADGYIGSPMLSALYGVWAAWLGDRERSLSLFEEGYARFVTGRFAQTLEYRPDRFPDQPLAGPFCANLAGFLLGCLCGLPGLRPDAGDPAGWCRRPVVLPAGWETIEVERLWVRGRPARLVARHGDERARIELQSA
jgi:trehalose/maltose hydrolase-like predicted phosphorylase